MASFNNTKEYQLTQKSQDFLKACYPLFGKSIVNLVEESLTRIPEEKQHDFIHMILHFCFTEQIETSDDVNLTMLLSPIIESIPELAIRFMQLMHPEHSGNSMADVGQGS